MSATDDALTPFVGLVPWAAFVRRCGLLEALSASCPAVRSSPNAAPVHDVLQTYALTVLCDGDRFAHVQRLRCDPALAEPFGVKAIVSDDTIGRLFHCTVRMRASVRTRRCGIRPRAVPVIR